MRQSRGYAQDHIHLFVSIPPQVTVSRFAQLGKERASHKLLCEYPHLQKTCRGRQFWTRGYFCCSSGKVTDEVIKQYIEGQDSVADDNFKVDSEP